MILKKGFLLAFEGIDGTRKTIQAKLFYERRYKRNESYSLCCSNLKAC
jgi:thymidylate kinase